MRTISLRTPQQMLQHTPKRAHSAYSRFTVSRHHTASGSTVAPNAGGNVVGMHDGVTVGSTTSTVVVTDREAVSSPTYRIVAPASVSASSGTANSSVAYTSSNHSGKVSSGRSPISIPVVAAESLSESSAVQGSESLHTHTISEDSSNTPVADGNPRIIYSVTMSSRVKEDGTSRYSNPLLSPFHAVGAPVVPMHTSTDLSTFTQRTKEQVKSFMRRNPSETHTVSDQYDKARQQISPGQTHRSVADAGAGLGSLRAEALEFELHNEKKQRTTMAKRCERLQRRVEGLEMELHSCEMAKRQQHSEILELRSERDQLGTACGRLTREHARGKGDAALIASLQARVQRVEATAQSKSKALQDELEEALGKIEFLEKASFISEHRAKGHFSTRGSLGDGNWSTSPRGDPELRQQLHALKTSNEKLTRQLAEVLGEQNQAAEEAIDREADARRIAALEEELSELKVACPRTCAGVLDSHRGCSVFFHSLIYKRYQHLRKCRLKRMLSRLYASARRLQGGGGGLATYRHHKTPG